VIPLSLQIVLALLLDAAIGDPRWLPHPVIGIGRFALYLEQPLRKQFDAKVAGIIAVIVVVLVTTVLTWGLCLIASSISQLLGNLVAILVLYSGFAMRDLRGHALAVYRPLVAGDIAKARQQVAMLVGRDTEKLDEGEITRAAVESVAENTVDGVTAPLIFAFIAGPVGVMFYKAVNTLDSTFGYKNERYLQFGWAAARFDDLVNFFPARLTALLIPVAARLLKFDGPGAWRILQRDRHNHPSPNGGQTEAAFAGALGVQLGGINYYGGEESNRPQMGDPVQPLRAAHIQQAVRLMVVISLLVVVCCVVVKLIF